MIRRNKIAIHLPQFHPIPENDEWWGKGFTEWTNVTAAKPRFKSHNQPHLPADLGFYDLRFAKHRLEQEKLAKEYGLDGFCYYHYWFNGKRLLEEPLAGKMNNPEEDFPFMLCWANENWTRRWDGMNHEVLIEQKHSYEDDIAHIRYLWSTYFKDNRYIKVDGKPVLMIYKIELFENIEKTIKTWRDISKAEFNSDIHIGYFQNSCSYSRPEDYGFDFSAHFQPDFCAIPQQLALTLNEKVKNKLSKGVYKAQRGHVYKYADYVKAQIKLGYRENVFPCLVPGWDNTARRKVWPFILHESSPKEFEHWLRYILDNFPWHKNETNFLFFNAWNEWAEGNHLEPCKTWGRAFLEVIKRVTGK